MPHDWTLKPSGVDSGDNFRLLFVTSARRNASATAIATYNTFVQSSAKAGHSAITDSCGNQFKVVGSTSAVDARDNTSTTGNGEAIYWLSGAKVADSYSDFYDGSWDSYVGKTETGANISAFRGIATGTTQNGTKHSSDYLGSTNRVRTFQMNNGGNPFDRSASSSTGTYSFYALSPVFTVGAQPPTVSISAPTDANEGNSGTTNKLFSVTLSSAHTAPISVRVCYSGTATRGASADYQSRFSIAISTNSCATRLIATGSTGTNAYGIQIRGDTDAEPDETVIATLSLVNPPAGVVLGTSTATYTILNDDNNAPTVDNVIPNQTATAGTAFSYAFPANTFSDADSDSLTYTATKSDDTALPSWLTFTAVSRAFSGTPQAANVGTLSVKVTANDGNSGTVSDTFDIVVSAADTTAPGVTSIERQSPTAQYTNADSLTWRVTFSEAVRNVDMADFSLVLTTTTVAFPGTTTLAVSSVSTSVYDIRATGSGIENADTSIQLVFASGHDIEDLSGNDLPASPSIPGASNDNYYTLDNTAPTVRSIERQMPTTAMTDEDSLTWRVTFADANSGEVRNVDAADFQVTGTTATISDVSEHDTNIYDVTASGGDLDNLNGTVTLSIKNTHDITDDVGNALPASPTPTSGTNDNTFNVQNVVVDAGAPQVVSIKRHAQEVRNLGTSLVWRVEFDKHLPGVYASDFTLTGTTAGLDVRHDLSNYDPVTYKTSVLVIAQGGDLDTVSGTVTLGFASNHNIVDFEGRRLASTTPSGTNQSFTLNPNQTLVYFTQENYYVDEGEEAVLTLRLSRLRDTATTISALSATPLTATGNGVDYHGQTYSVTIPAYRASGTFRIRTSNDTLTEDEETFRVDIHGPLLPAGVAVTTAPGATGNDGQTYIHIRDEDTATAKAKKEPGLVFDNAHLTWNEADGCGNTGPTYNVKLKTEPLGPVEVFIEDPDDNYRSDYVAKGRLSIDNTPPSVGEQGGAYEIHDDGTYSTHPLPKLDEDTVLHFTPDNWDTWQLVNVKVRCSDHYTAQIPIKHRLYTNYIGDKGKLSHAYPGYTGVVDKGWTVHVYIRENDPPITVKPLPAEGTTVDVKEGSHLDFEITLSEAAFKHDSTLTVYLSARGGKAAGVKRRDGDAQSCGGPLDDCLIFTPSNRTQWVRLFAINPGRDELKVEIPQLLWGGLEHVRDWEMRWPVEVIQAGQASPLQAEAAQPTSAEEPSCVSAELMADAQLAATETWRSPGHVERWSRVLAAFGEKNSYSSNPMTVAEAQAQADRGLKRWAPVAPALECLASQPVEDAQPAEEEEVTPTTPILSLSAGTAITEGSNASFTITADPAPSTDITVTYTVTQSGDYLATPGAGARTATLAAGTTSTTLTVATVDDTADEADGSVSVTLDTGTGYSIATGKGSGAIVIADNDKPVVSITAGPGVTEGTSAAFTITADPVPAAPLDVALTVGQSGDFATSGQTGQRTVTIPVSGTATFTVATDDDTADEPDGSITATIDTGTGYSIGSPAAATVTVTDNDATTPSTGPTISIADATMNENQHNGWFTVTLSEKVAWPVHVYYATRDSTPVSAVAGQDYLAWKRSWQLRARFRPGQTETKIHVPLYNDSHDEDPETFEMVLFDAGVNGPPDVSVSIADGVATGTITNSDPMPAAFLSRFGRTVAQQALDGIESRLAADRSPGTAATIAGQALALGTAGQAADSPLDDLLARPGPTEADPFGHHPPEPLAMTAREALLASSFTTTGETASGSLAIWGRAARDSFDGREGTFSLDGTATTAMLGVDYARDRWLLGMALLQSSGKGSYADSDVMPRPEGQICPEDMENTIPCAGAIRTGDGKVKTSLTALVPYASIQTSERLRLWAALGHGSGEVTLTPQMGGTLTADTSWQMAAAGMRAELSAIGSGTLHLTSDALWSRTRSEKTHQLAASDATVTRLRAGMEASWQIALESGAMLTPGLEIGARHDGGDAEQGAGIELGGSLGFRDPASGFAMDLSARKLIAHDDDDFEENGLAASFTFDPEPASARGLSVSLRQDAGTATGGMDTLFMPEVLERQDTGATATTAEAAYGLPALAGRFTIAPHARLRMDDASRDTTLGLRLTPERGAPDLSLGLEATRREHGAAAPVHGVGVGVTVRW